MPSPLRIDQLPAASPLTGAEEFPTVQGGTAKQGLLSQILAYIAANLPAFTFPFTGLAYSPSAGGTVRQATPADITPLVANAYGNRRVLYSKSYWNDLSDFTSSGTAPTIVNGAIRMAANPNGDFSGPVLELANPITADDSHDFEIVISLVSNASYGIAVGRSGYGLPALIQYNANANNSYLNIFQSNNTYAGTQISAGTPITGGAAVGDVIRLIYSQRSNTITGSEYNLTQRTKGTLQAVNAFGPNSSGWDMPASQRFRVYSVGYSFDILSMRVVTRQPTIPTMVVVGDSKSLGKGAVTPRLRYASLISSLGSVAMYAGSGDQTAYALQGAALFSATGAKYAILEIGCNDLRAGVPAATWQTNYAAIVSALKAGRATVIHLLPIPESSLDQSVLTSYINTTYPGDVRVDVTGTFSTGTDLAADGIHPNASGHRKIAAAILASGAISSPLYANVRDTAEQPENEF